MSNPYRQLGEVEPDSEELIEIESKPPMMFMHWWYDFISPRDVRHLLGFVLWAIVLLFICSIWVGACGQM